jgi:CheY-like chemotaxis protein
MAGSLRVLVVDDTPSIRFLIRMNLEISGHVVTEAVDGQDCLDYLEQLAVAGDALPDVVTFDIVMPRLDGISTVERLRGDDRFANLGIVMVTTQSQQVDISRAHAAGVDAYIVKPFDLDDLIETVERIAAQRREVQGR